MVRIALHIFFIIQRAFGVSQWYQWYTNIVQGFTNGTIGNTICTIGNANCTIGSPNGTIGTIGKPMVQLVKLPMVPLGEPRMEPQHFTWQFLKQYLANLQPEHHGNSSTCFIQLEQMLCISVHLTIFALICWFPVHKNQY